MLHTVSSHIWQVIHSSALCVAQEDSVTGSAFTAICKDIQPLIASAEGMVSEDPGGQLLNIIDVVFPCEHDSALCYF